MNLILDLKPTGSKQDVLITYFDDKTFQTKEILLQQKHIIPTVEINSEKYDLDKIMTDLENKYPDFEFELKNFGQVQNSKIIWQKGNRENKKILEYYPKQNKQLFITNHSQRFYPRSISGINIEDTLKQIKNIKEISEIKILEDKSLILKSNKLAIKKLPDKIFKIKQYESKPIIDLEKAREKKIQIKKSLKNHLDGISIVETQEGYKIRVRTFNHLQINKRFINFKELELGAKEIKYDPLNLNSPKKQLRDTHPLYTELDINKKLEDQINLNLNPYAGDLEKIIQKVLTYYKKNTAVIDLEVTEYGTTQNLKNQTPSGKIFMAVLKSQTENNIYLTNKAHNKKIREKLNYQDANIIYLDNEKDLILKLEEDSKKYDFILGYNFDDYDQLHLTKYNQQESVLWSKKQEQILDAYKFAKNRLSILKDQKLSSLANFEKSISYEEMEKLLKEKTPQSIKKIIEYTNQDGEKTWDVLTKILRYAIIESMSVNKPVSSIFRSKPSKNFYEAGQRKYFIKLNTYRDRHEFSPMKHYKKFEERESNEEIMTNLLNPASGLKRIEGTLYYPTIFLEPLKEIIFTNPLLSKSYRELLDEKNPLNKLLLINLLSSSLTVPVDKIKNHIENNNLEFAKLHSSKDMYSSNSDHLKLNQESFIFSKTYDIPNYVTDINGKDLSITMLNLNNEIAMHLINLEYEYSAGNLLINSNKGIKIGDFKGIILGKNELIGKVNDFDITYGKNFPKNKYLKDLLNTYLSQKSLDVNEWMNKIPKDLNSDQLKIAKAILQVTPNKNKSNTLYLF